MKTLNTIRYILFGFIVLGAFASFAQNDYGLDIIYVSEFFIGIIFLAEAILYFRNESKVNKKRSYYLFFEHFLLSLLFFAFSASRNPSAFPRITIMISLFGIFLLYLIYGVRMLIRESKKGKLVTILTFLFNLAALCALFGFSFKISTASFFT